MKLSRLMGHSSGEVAEIHLEDIQSHQARSQHATYSGVGDLRLPKSGRGHLKYRRPPKLGKQD